VPVFPTHTPTRTEVEMLADLGRWRRELFRHLRLHNPACSAAQIDDAVQRLLERLVFIRICEDRGIEKRRLLPLLRHEDLAAQLNALFREFERVYGGQLFAPHLCEELTGEAAAYERVIEGLVGRYDFSAIDADVLGMVYEQYLGRQVGEPGDRQAAESHAKRKARGIYYTPQPVVRYIVAQTVGHLLQERTGEQTGQLKVLDMACGSGSFLIEAFDVLDRYSLSPEVGGGGRGVRSADALYGVDLDPHAVEIARLNLLLRALDRPGRLSRPEAVRQGNSLISGTPAELEAAFGPGWRDKHPFNWEEEFRPGRSQKTCQVYGMSAKAARGAKATPTMLGPVWAPSTRDMGPTGSQVQSNC